MKPSSAVTLSSLALAVAAWVPWHAEPAARPAPPAPVAAPQDADEQAAMAAAWESAQRYLALGPQHEKLKRFLGTWDTELRFTMAGMKDMPPEKGSTTWRWLTDGRWLMSDGTGTMMGQPIEQHTLLGYDPLKQKFVAAMVNGHEPFLLASEGYLTRDDDALILYGTMDEYLTGEHDKPVKYVWRFRSPDHITMEVHDLAIGETDTQVVQIEYRRRS